MCVHSTFMNVCMVHQIPDCFIIVLEIAPVLSRLQYGRKCISIFEVLTKLFILAQWYRYCIIFLLLFYFLIAQIYVFRRLFVVCLRVQCNGQTQHFPFTHFANCINLTYICIKKYNIRVFCLEITENHKQVLPREETGLSQLINALLPHRCSVLKISRKLDC